MSKDKDRGKKSGKKVASKNLKEKRAANAEKRKEKKGVFTIE